MKRSILFTTLLIPTLVFADNYIVTAEKISKSTKETSNSITVITEDQIEKSGAQSFKDIIQSIPGVYISSNGSLGGISTLRIRGASTGFSKVVIDGLEMNDSSNPDYAFEINQLDISNIEQIEILKGSQSVIYGSEAIGGVIKITTKQSKEKKTNISLTAGSFNTKAMSFSSTGSKNKVSYSLGGSFYITDGISSYNEKRTVHAEKDRYNRVNLKSLLKYQFSKKSSLSYQAHLLKSDLDIDSFGADKESGDNSSYDQNLHKLTYSTRLFKDLLKSDLSYAFTDVYRNNEAQPATFRGKNKKVTWNGTHYVQKSLTALYGLEYDYQETTQKFSGSTNIEKSTDVSSAYVSTHFTQDKFFFDLGLRQDKHQAYDSHSTYKVGAGLNLPRNIVLKSTYATGYKAPTIYQLNIGANPNHNLRPTESKSYDFTLIVPHSIASLELSYFNFDYKNQIKYTGTWGVNDKYDNIDESRINGYELAINLSLNKYLSWDNGFTYTKSKDKMTGLDLLKTPKKVARSVLTYSHNKSFSAATTFKYVGERFDFGQKRIPSYLVGDMVFNYENIQARVANILNKEYEDTDTYGTPDRSYYLSYKLEL